MNLKNLGYKLAAVAFTAVLAVGGILTVALPQKDFSDNENRVLQTAPEFSLDALLHNELQADLDAYVTDQFPARDMWTAVGAAFKKWTGRKDIGGAYLGKDGYYFEKITDNHIDQTKFKRNVALLEAFAKANACETELMLVPSAGTVLTDKMPAYAPLYDVDKLFDTANALLQNVTVHDLRDPLKQAAQTGQVYYKTDHHWTTDGAALGYTALTGHEAPALETVSEDFYGTLYSKTLDSAARPDSVKLAPLADTVTATADGKPCDVYAWDNLNEKDKYTVFFGGNHGLVTMTGGCQNGKTLLLVKDSFANCLAPMLTADYETVLLVDLRFYKGAVSDLVAEQQVDKTVVLYEASGFANANFPLK